MTHLKAGDQAPNFSVKNEKDEIVTLNDYQGKKVVIYFYPKDNTPGCTAQACNLRDNYGDLQNAGYDIIGVSADSVKKHQNFIDKQNLPFTLLADEDKTMLNDYGVWGPKKFMGREYEGIHRVTFILNEDHTIKEIIEKVKTKDHTAQILG